MENLLVKLMVLAALTQLGISVSKFAECRGRACAQVFDRASRDVLRVDWRPISVWPEEEKRFR